jgi:hypothetical protein
MQRMMMFNPHPSSPHPDPLPLGEGEVSLFYNKER